MIPVPPRAATHIASSRRLPREEHRMNETDRAGPASGPTRRPRRHVAADPLASLKQAVKRGRLDQVQAWIASGKTLLYPPDSSRRSVIELAAESGFYSLVETLAKVWPVGRPFARRQSCRFDIDEEDHVQPTRLIFPARQYAMGARAGGGATARLRLLQPLPLLSKITAAGRLGQAFPCVRRPEAAGIQDRAS